MFKNPFSFDGRIRRTEYGISVIIYFVINLFSTLITESMGETGPIITLVLLIPMLWFFWAQGAKRCHDIGRNGFWQIIPFYIFALLFSEGDPGRNEYGTNPKFPDQVDVLESETLDGHLKD